MSLFIVHIMHDNDNRIYIGQGGGGGMNSPHFHAFNSRMRSRLLFYQ